MNLIKIILLVFMYGHLIIPLSAQVESPQLIPLPTSYESFIGKMSHSSLHIYGADSLQHKPLPLEGLLLYPTGKFLPEPGSVPFLHLVLDSSLHTSPEYYRIQIMPSHITLTGTTYLGILRGVQTINQLRDSDGSYPSCQIEDYPRFSYRGMHLDVCRHFFPVSFIKKYIDLLAYYKFNTFHWHLTEDQGWRIEIQKYPKLTEVGAWRKGSQIGPYAKQEFDTIRYGGFYTQNEIKEVVAYAADNGIAIIPEIEMPGHALAALAAYPEFSCTGGPFEVATGWGVFEDVFCPKEETFEFLEGILDEVIALFPSPIIHIGGDECPKTRWKQCAHCQALMKAKNIADEYALQSYFIHRIEKYVNSKGRNIIGWDEILEGGLAPNASVMSWRGTEGGIAAAKAGHDVVMTPGSHCYFDHYQGDPAYEPLAIGGLTTVQKVYAYEPVPRELDSLQAQHILGAQANVWTEYILDENHVEYMVLPRMLALSEVLWSQPHLRDEPHFMRRVEREMSRLKDRGYHYATSMYQVQLVPSQGEQPGSIRIQAKTPIPNMPVTITITKKDSLPVSLIASSVNLDSDAEVKAQMIANGLTEGIDMPESVRQFSFNLATARPISCEPLPHESYQMGGPFTLVDGVAGGHRRISSEWLGWKTDVTITLDLGEIHILDTVQIGSYHEPHSWIHRPEFVSVETSLDGTHFQKAGNASPPTNSEGKGGRIIYSLKTNSPARYIQMKVRNRGKIPEGNPGEGQPAWLFLDEIIVTSDNP